MNTFMDFIQKFLGFGSVVIVIIVQAMFLGTNFSMTLCQVLYL